MVVPVMLWCLNAVSNFEMKSGNVLMAMVVPVMVFCLNVVAQVRADPLVMYERAKVIFLLSVS